MARADLKPDFHVVGIGASAGGLDALRTFFSRMAAEPGFACVVVVHLSPEHESHLVQLLQPYTLMPVCQVVQTTALEPNHVYVIPPNANLNSIDTHLRLSQLETRRLKRAPIDHFLRTLAETHGETAVGVILSGAGSDGALGIRQIKEYGGLTLAQDPREAEYDSMPQSAIATGTVDLVLSVVDMPEQIAGYCATRPAIGTSLEGDDLSDGDASLLERILGEVRQRTGQEFATYRRSLLLQRVRRRMRLRHVDTLGAYLDVLRGQFDEPRALYTDLLFNVTEFFRDADTYDLLERLVDEILDRKGEEARVRVWSIGCSTGEEAYSLAMVLLEQASRRNASPRVQVFASELSPNALQLAREGVYPQEIAGSVSPQRLDRFFLHEDGCYRVRRELRDVVTFATHDLFRDPPFSHLDLIVCRKMLSQLRGDARRGAAGLFYYSLEPNGMLVIDRRDEIEAPGFIRDRANPRLLRRFSGPEKRPIELPLEMRPFDQASGEHAGAQIYARSFDTATVFRAAVERYTPPSVLIDVDNLVVHFSPTAARYVRLPGGEITADILRLTPETIAYHLRKGLEVVRGGVSAWRSEPFAVATEGALHRLVVRIDRADAGPRASEMLLVLFDDGIGAALPGSQSPGEHGALKQVLRLQDELTRAHQEVVRLTRQRSAVPASEAQLGSDSLRTVVEELEDAREELQTVNEELISLNDESQYRLETLAQVSNDLQHLLESTGLATMLVDRSLKIVRYTPLMAEVFRLKGTDIGRPLSDVAHRMRYPNLIPDLRRVVDQLCELAVEIPGTDDSWFLVRAQPYRSALRGLEGAVLVLVDITARKKAELALREADRRKDEFIAVLAHELRNPLAPIGAGIEVLRKLPDDPALVRRISATMARQTQQLVRLVDDLLEVSRISGGKLTLRIKPVSIAEVVRDSVSAVRPLLDSLEHQLSVALPEEPLVVDGDAARLTQVVANLLHNAARYTPRGGQISLTACRVDEQVLISVRDNGLGIAPQSLPNVFDMFYQGNNPETVNNTGLGIGLTLAKKLVEMHAGSISAESSGPDTGSTFTVRLPLARATAESSASEGQAEAAPATDRHRVLIVDDNVDAAETLKLLMTTMGSGEVRTASSGAEALTIGAQLRPDVVLLDLGMPGMDGYEVARRMRGEAWGKAAVLVALTGWGQDQHRQRSRQAGFDRHMTKPADPEVLRAVLQEVSAN